MEKSNKRFLSIVLAFVLCFSAASTLGVNATGVGSVSTRAFEWKSVPFGAGGRITSIVSHPKEENLRYIKTDIGGAYRWNETEQAWVPIFNKMSDHNLYGVASLAVDPNDVNIVYACLGKYNWSTGGVYKSTDKGATWTKILDKRFWSNGSFKSYGESIAVDPKNSLHLIVGTAYQGAFETFDGGITWASIAALPAVSDTTAPITSIIMDEDYYYAAVATYGIYKYTVATQVWSLLENSPANTIKMETTDDILFASDINGVYKCDGTTFDNIMGDFPYESINTFTVNKSDSDYVAVVGKLDGYEDKMCMPVCYTTDGGKTWKNAMKNSVHTSTIGWFPNEYFSSNTSCLEFDPFSKDSLWLTDLCGLWMTEDLTETQTVWTNPIKGIEETTAFDMISLPGDRARLITGLADQRGAYYEDFSSYPESLLLTAPKLMSVTSLDFCESNPNFVVLCGVRSGQKTGGGAYSADGGKSWIEFTGWPTDEDGNKIPAGRITVSSDNNNGVPVILLASIGGLVYRSVDCGATFTVVSAFGSLCNAYWSRHQVIDSDKAASDTFYAISEGDFYKSTDDAATWELVSSPNLISIKSDFSTPHTVWGVDENGNLFLSENGGDTFSQIDGVSAVEVNSFDTAKGEDESDCAAICFYGKLNNTEGMYRSFDRGNTWENITSDSWFLKNRAVVVTGDRQNTGGVFVSTDGSGAFYGVPSNDSPNDDSNEDFDENTGDAAYSNTFDDANSLTGWHLSDTTNNVVESEQLKFKNYKSIYAMYNGQSWNGGNFVADFTLSTSSNRMRYFFNYSESNSVSSGYMLQLQKTDNSVSLLKFTNGTSGSLTAATSSVISTLDTVTGRSDLMVSNVMVSNVKVVYKNGNIKVYIGGGKVFDYTDNTPLNSGKMGFSASSGAGYADNFSVTPDKTIVDGIIKAGTKEETQVVSSQFVMPHWISNAAGKTASVDENGDMNFGYSDNFAMIYLGHETESSYIADFTLRQLGSSTGNSAEIRFNATDNKNYYKIKLEGGNSTKEPKMILQKIVNGTTTDLHSVAHVSVEKTQTIRVEYENGGNISVYSVDADGCATPIMQDIKDTTFTGGYVGVGANSASLKVSEIKITEKEMMIFAPKVYVDGSLVAELPEEEGKDFTLKFKPSFEIEDADTNILVAGYSGDTLADVKMISQATQSQFIDENSQIVVTFEVAEGEKIDKVAVYCWKMSTLVPLLDAIRVK